MPPKPKNNKPSGSESQATADSAKPEDKAKTDAASAPEGDVKSEDAATPQAPETAATADPQPPEGGEPNNSDDPDGVETPTAEAGERVLVLKRDAALGNGTRKKGEVLCAIQRGDDGHLDFDSAEPVEGVEPVELETAFRNLHLLDVLTPTADAR